MNMESFGKNPVETVDEQEKHISEMKDFLDMLPQTESQSEEYQRIFSALAEKQPEALEKILDATKDSREVWTKLRDRSSKTLQDLGIELEWIQGLYDSNGGFMTPEGLEKAKSEAQPDQFKTPDGITVDMMPEKYKSFSSWDELHEYLLVNHRFDGLSKEQIDEVLEAEQDMEDARSIREDLRHQLFAMGSNHEIAIRREGPAAANPLLDSLNEMAYKKRLLRAKLYGKIQKLRFAPRFIADKVDDFVDNVKEDVKKFFNKKDNEE